MLIMLRNLVMRFVRNFRRDEVDDDALAEEAEVGDNGTGNEGLEAELPMEDDDGGEELEEFSEEKDVKSFDDDDEEEVGDAEEDSSEAELVDSDANERSASESGDWEV